jgi:dTDP-glucose 4,6-dehydratase
METCLVTGGAGFIGSNFIRHLLGREEEIRIINLDKLTYAGNEANLKDVRGDTRYIFRKGDIAHKTEVISLFKKYRPDSLVNFAAETHVDRSITEPGRFVRTNILGIQNLLKMSLHFGIGRFVQISTDEVYGSLGNTGHFTEKSPVNPRNPYAASKASGDMMALAYHRTYGLPVIISRSSNNYGPFQFPEKFIPVCIARCLAGHKIPLYGDGMQVRDWIFVDDHCSAIGALLADGRPGEIYNIGANSEKTNLEVARRIIQLLADEFPDRAISDDLIRHVEDRKGHDRRYAMDARKIREELGWRPRIPFDAGLKRTVSWYINHRSWLDQALNRM